MQVISARHIDSSDSDENEMYDYYYEYDIYEFIDENVHYIARAYVDEPFNAHFLKMKSEGEDLWRIIEEQDMNNPLFRNAVAFLKEKGKTNIQYLSSGPRGYLDI
ncbi:hypothetical protein F3J20_12205 [Paraburkholderia sp. Cy-641]|uniref:hypothetical protein n=1 Tax=Paraburkholderia sp. Cy-641 TaxID=2608337 RepID=UPI00141E985C|nr:hypothetical protein [Paraburkholderia sp. Cy-641]NIF78143.1 hypothetical protein [Paraburkholderia sp. Cy-641]